MYGAFLGDFLPYIFVMKTNNKFHKPFRIVPSIQFYFFEIIFLFVTLLVMFYIFKTE